MDIHFVSSEVNKLLEEDKVIVSEEHDVYEKVHYRTSGYLNADVRTFLLFSVVPIECVD